MNIETIRRITIETRERGAEQAARSLKELANAQETVGKSSLSVEKAYEGLQRKLDTAHRAQREFEKDVRILAQAQAQGLIPNQARLNELMALSTQRYQQATGAMSPLAQAMAQAQTQAAGLAGHLGGVGSVLISLGPAGLVAGAALGAAAIGTTKLVEAVNDLADRAGKMVDFAETTGLTTRQIQALNRAGAEVGLTSDKIGQGFERFTVQLEELKDGSGQLFDQLNKISPALLLQASAAKTTAEAWDVLTKAYEQADLTQRNALARAAFGRTGIGMGRLLSASAEAGGIGGLEGNLSRFSPSQEDLRRWDELKDKIDITGRTAKDIFTSVFADEVLRSQLKFMETMEAIAEIAKRFTLSDDWKTLQTILSYSPPAWISWLMGKGGEAIRTLAAGPMAPGGGGGGWGGSGGTPSPANNNMPSRNEVAPGTLAALEKANRLHEAALMSIRAQTREQRLLAVEMEKAAELSTTKLTKEQQSVQVAQAREQAEAKLNRQFEDQIRSLNQQAQLTEARSRGDEAAVRTMQAYADAIRQGASGMQAMAIAAATMRNEVAKAKEDMARFDEMEAAASQERLSGGGGGGGGGGRSTSGRTTFTTGFFTNNQASAALDAIYGAGNALMKVTQFIGIMTYQNGRIGFPNVDRAAVDSFRQQEQTAKLQEEVARQLIMGVGPAAIQQQILQGKIGTGMYREFFGPDQMATASADAMFKAILDLEQRAGADPASTLARIRGGDLADLASKVSTQELLQAIDSLTQAVQNNTQAMVGISPFYTEKGDRLFGYRGFATGGMVYGPETVRVGEREPEMIIPWSRLMGSGNDNARSVIINQEININAEGVNANEVGQSAYQAIQTAQSVLFRKAS